MKTTLMTIALVFACGSALLAQEIRPARRAGLLPTEPFPPSRVVCWGDTRPDGTNSNWAYSDCVDPEQPGECISKAVQAKKKTTQNCPACIEDCTSALKATYDAAKAEHDRKIAPCTGGMIQSDGYYICLTDREAFPDEQKPSDIPVGERKRKVLHCNHFDPETGQTSHVVRTEPITTPLDGAIMIDPNVTIDASFTCIEGPLLKKMQALCCEMCPDNCWVHAGAHGQCPFCKCDDSCWKHCLVQE